MKVHRRSMKMPPRPNGKVLTLCGRYLPVSVWVSETGDDVSCQMCITATTSQRTIDQRRLEFKR